jgi:hypothetical protein
MGPPFAAFIGIHGLGYTMNDGSGLGSYATADVRIEHRSLSVAFAMRCMR